MSSWLQPRTSQPDPVAVTRAATRASAPLAPERRGIGAEGASPRTAEPERGAEGAWAGTRRPPVGLAAPVWLASLAGGVAFRELAATLAHAVPDDDEADPPDVEGDVVDQEHGVKA